VAASVERALRALQHAVRAPEPKAPDRRTQRSGPIPDDLQTEAAKSMILWAPECDALDELAQRLADDLRFEHMDAKEIDAAVWRFACQATLQRSEDHVKPFVSAHARSPEEHTCYFPVEHLKMPAASELYGVTFLPWDDAAKPLKGPWPVPEGASVVAVPCCGTSRKAMAERARPLAEHALRILRATLREHPGIVDRQLRFRLDESYWFEDGLGGWSLHPEKGWELELHESFLPYATDPSIATLPAKPRNEIGRRAHRALTWIEEAQLAVDPLAAVLALFYALETLLGDSDPGQKGPRLAVRRATLGARVRGQFQHPIDVIVLYDEVRSCAVHGDTPSPISERAQMSLARSVRHAISEFLTYAATNGLKRRADVVASLQADENWRRIIDELIKPNPNWHEHVRHLPGSEDSP